MNANQRISSPNNLTAPLLINELKNDNVNHWCNELDEENSFSNVKDLNNQQSKIISVPKDAFMDEFSSANG
ncbi:hypothetical protein [Halobacillus naozhouensis]|uniref:Uncharacterized protein n=1 Tax=Halobacillus naozhouensis TaxID=554880 RepID=A0ABY8J378_9BACI|nr:hypothetical protein [Halobacillus naozhouensis]WFT76546.1 hypothetical protein P9989_09360 [Halobacillus naozhouensis]